MHELSHQQAGRWLLFCAFILIVSGFSLHSFQSTNQAIFLSVNGFFAATPDLLLVYATLLGDTFFAAIFILLAYGRRLGVVVNLLFIALALAACIRIMKVVLDVSRPSGVLEEGLFNSVGHAFVSYSLPSGHSATSALVACILAMRYWSSTPICILCALYALVGGVSRIAVGVHWPADVLAGMGIGLLFGALVFLLHKPILSQKTACIVVAFVAFSGFIVAMIKTQEYDQFFGVWELHKLGAFILLVLGLNSIKHFSSASFKTHN